MNNMVTKLVRQHHFAKKEIHVSVALIVVWSFVTVAVIMFVMRALGLFSGGFGVFSFIAILFFYSVAVVLLTILFSHRLVGPFERLNAEIDEMLLSDGPLKRLRIRTRDDLHVRTFVEHVNRIIEELDNSRQWSDYCLLQVRSRLGAMLNKVKSGEISPQAYKEQFEQLNEKINSLIDEHRYKKE